MTLSETFYHFINVREHTWMYFRHFRCRGNLLAIFGQKKNATALLTVDIGNCCNWQQACAQDVINVSLILC